MLELTEGSTRPVVPTDKRGFKDWVKTKQLKHLASLLAKLAGKVAAALPRVIGTVLAWLLTVRSAVG